MIKLIDVFMACRKMILYMDAHQVSEQPEDFKEPDNDNNHNDNIEDGFNFSIHGNVGVDKPKKNTCDNQYD
jgi:hypothetical protein